MMMMVIYMMMMVMMVLYDDNGQVDAVPAADVTWWLEGEQIENRDEFLLGDNQSALIKPLSQQGVFSQNTYIAKE